MQNYHKYNTVETTETQGDTEDDREAQQDSGIKDNKNISRNKQDPEDDELSMEYASPEESHITINDLNTVKQMNKAQINIDPEMGEDVTEDCPESLHKLRNNRSNPRPMPTKRNITKLC